MNKERIITIAFWGAIIVGGLWVTGVFGNGSTKTQSYQKSTSIDDTSTPKIYVPSLDSYTIDSEDKISIPQTFGENPCTVDCSGHEAGYNWAEEKGITDPDDCGGNSQSFIEGCETYANEYNDNSDYTN